jgi:peptidoglycan/xylan/chitin deacetylase (PgdA/CDA1 family)
MRYQQKISQVLSFSGLLRAIELLPSRPGVVTFSHHRIGNRNECDYNTDLISATAEQFDYQLAYLKRHIPTLLPHELAELMTKKKRLTRLHAIITFDDGYLDNYTHAFPLLQQHGLHAAFFLITSFVGTSHLPWWDEIAYLVRHTTRASLAIACGSVTTVDLAAGREQAIHKLVTAFKSEENRDPAAFMQQLRSEAQVPAPKLTRRFIDWKEAKEMAAAGMEIGAHTHTHPLLSRLSSLEQQAEMRESKTAIERMIGFPVTSLAYPNGSPRDFTAETRQIACDLGYTAAFSFYGGVNPPDGGERYNILRRAPKAQPTEFRTELALMSGLGARKSIAASQSIVLHQDLYSAK